MNYRYAVDTDAPLLADINQQLVAGSSRNQADFGLVTTMPDYADVLAAQRGEGKGARGRHR